MLAAAEQRKNQAKRLLVHYFTLAGVVRDGDNRAEIEAIVDMIFDAVLLASQEEPK
jgi:hypothetical protein